MRKTAIALLLTLAAGVAHAAPPETVMITYRAKRGSEAQLAQVVAKHWDTARRLELVTSDPRHLYRAGSMLIEVFTWKDAEIPDHAPAEIRAIWDEMNALVEKGGISILEVERVGE